jgi:hypothetical protein
MAGGWVVMTEGWPAINVATPTCTQPKPSPNEPNTCPARPSLPTCYFLPATWTLLVGDPSASSRKYLLLLLLPS